MRKRKDAMPQAIREAVDFCPSGLCFSMPDGRPILVNRQMNHLIALLTGHTVLDAEDTWAELHGTVFANGCTKLEKPWAEQDGPDDFLAFALPDGTVWQFRRDLLPDEQQGYRQMEAADVTQLYRLSEKLYENNCRLRELQQRQKRLLTNIVQINRERELLAVKMQVHDELGQCLIATRRMLRGQTPHPSGAALAKNWEDAIRDLTNIPLEETSDTSQEAELLQVAEMIGCRIAFMGERPTEQRALRLLYAAVREALTNAVRHAGADRLQVVIRRSGADYQVAISDNGHAAVSAVREGDGLGNLRKRLEQEGAAMEIRCDPGVTLLLELPGEGEKRKRGEAHDKNIVG